MTARPAGLAASDAAPSSRSVPVLPVAVGTLFILAIVAWANGFRTPFVFDDDVAVVHNASIRRLSWQALVPPARRIMAGRPVPNLTFALNFAVGGLDPTGYHVVNLLLHLAAALALLGIVRRTLPRAGLPASLAGAEPWLALVVAAVWLVHPLQTDAVTYVTQRTEVVMGLAYLLTLYAAIRAWDGPRPWTGLAIGACGLGMASKEVMISAPLMVVLYDRVFLAPSFGGAWRRRRVLYAGLAAACLVLAALIVFTPRTETIGFDAAIGPWAYSTTQAGVLVQYLRLALWPDALCIDHGVWVARTAREIVPPGLLVLALLSGTALALARWRPVGFLGAWFFGILAPTSSFVPIVSEVMAERRMYLPLAAVVALVVVGGAAVGARIAGRRLRVLAGVAAVVVVAALTAATIQRNRAYTSEASILADTIRKRPGNYRARSNLATILIDDGRLDEAVAQLAEAIRLEPRFAQAHYNLGTAFLDQERYEDAVAELERTLRLEPSHVLAHVNLGTALLNLGRVEEARAQFARAVRLDPGQAQFRANLERARQQAATERNGR